ncbi:YchJ family metal-binding protein [Flavobacterium enshiense]|uniref:YchJ family protein n=1 Tax=Flavobacterium enshiense TaxID=1341165 RepID=UPI00345D05BE
MNQNCYCNSEKPFSECCEPHITGKTKPQTAEALMRSRYTAYCLKNVDYLIATTHISTRKHHNKKDILAFATENHWVRLEIVKATENVVEFKAYYLDSSLQPHNHHEKSTFKKEGEQWYYVDGKWY